MTLREGIILTFGIGLIAVAVAKLFIQSSPPVPGWYDVQTKGAEGR